MPLLTDDEFAALCKEKYCCPTSGLEGRKRIQMLEELARIVLSGHANDWLDRQALKDAAIPIVQDNERVKQLRER